MILKRLDLVETEQNSRIAAIQDVAKPRQPRSASVLPEFIDTRIAGVEEKTGIVTIRSLS